MIDLQELDLADPRAVPEVTLRPTWILVRCGPDVLGEIRVDALDARTACRLADDIRETYGATIDARAVPGNVADAGASFRVDAPASIAVVVCTRNRTALLADCLESIAELDPAPDEVIVIDNAPTDDDTERLCSARAIERVVEPLRGLDNARNRGWREATASVIVYVDDDARVDRRHIEAMRGVFAHRGVAAATGLVLAAELETYAQVYFERRLGGMRKGFKRRVLTGQLAEWGFESFHLGVGANMAFRREVLRDLGGFDPHLDVGTPSGGGGDLDMFFRVLDAGLTVVYEPNAMVRHIHRADRRGLIRQHRDGGSGLRAYLEATARRHPERRADINRYLSHWHWSRHVCSVVRAMVGRDLLGTQCLLAELQGSRHGAAAYRASIGTQQ